MERYKSKDKKIIDLKKEIKEKNHSTLKDRKPKMYNRIGKMLLLGLLVATSTRAYSEYSEVKDMKLIEHNASIQEAFRSFKNINREEMGKYLSGQIDILYQKYPDLDELIFYEDGKTKSPEFINDMYTLYKAFMVDEAEKEIEDIKDVKVTTIDQVIMASDRLTDGQKKLIETHKEQYKHITDKYIQAKEETKDGASLANEIYELLALELGLEPGVAKSEEMMEEIQEHGFYYDEKNNKFYTKDGPSSLVSNRNIEKMNETEKETQKTSEELELE